jgi:hypothetical protein
MVAIYNFEAWLDLVNNFEKFEINFTKTVDKPLNLVYYISVFNHLPLLAEIF